MKNKSVLESHILETWKAALHNSDIEVYYQPIIRTISHTICGAEAFARWKDKTYGMILPDDFIPVLEQNELMPVFDLYMLEKVCHNMQYIEANGHRAVPTCIRLSKYSFHTYDIVDVIEQTVKKYSIAKDLLCIEISQTMVMEDHAQMKQVIAQLKDRNYQVWLTGFTYDFQTLSILPSIPFDEIKIDISCLLSVDALANDMILANVNMIKKLGKRCVITGIQTQKQQQLAEGTAPDKLQGSLLCPLLSQTDILPYIRQSVYSMETKALRQYYDTICSIIQPSNRPFAIVEYDQKNFHILYKNQAFDDVCHSLTLYHFEDIDYMVNAPSSTLSRKFRYHQDSTRLGEDFIQMDYSVKGMYFRLRSKRICENVERVANLIEIDNITKNVTGNGNKENILDQIFRVMYSMYDSIYLLQPDNKMLNVMRSTFSEGSGRETDQSGILIDPTEAAQFVYPEDRESYLHTLNYTALKAMLKDTEKGFYTKYYRSSLQKGRYIWKAHTYQYIPDMDWIIYSTRTAPLYQERLAETIQSEFSSQPKENFDKALLHQLKDSHVINYVWKDTQRKILGISQQFAEHFQIDNKTYVLGKRDEDLGWMVDIHKTIEEEQQLLQTGEPVYHQKHKIITNGVTHSILVSREPIYQNGKIVGILCGIIDLDDLSANGIMNTTGKSKDELTGLLSAQGMLDTVSEYIEAMMHYHENFAIIRIEFKEQKYHYEQYGPVISEKISRGVANILRELAGNGAIIARLYAGSYVIIRKYTDEAAITQFVEQLRKHLQNIKDFSGYKVTLYPEFDIVFANETKPHSDLIAAATGGTEIDLNKRKLLEEQLTSYNLRLDAIVDTIPGGIALYEVCADGTHVIYASKGVGAITGRSTETFISDFERDHGAGILAQDSQMVSDAFFDALANHTYLNITYRLQHSNGKILWVNMQGKVIGEQNGHPLFLGVFRNLSESTSIYETILDESQAYIYVSAKKDGEILFANPKALSVVNKDHSVSEYYETIVRECTPDKKINGIYEHDRDRNQYEIELNHRNLLVFFVEGNWNGRAATICYISDITAKYIEERAKAARESLLYLEAINSSYDMIITFNLTKNSYDMHLNGTFLGFDWAHFPTYEDLITEVYKYVPEKEFSLEQHVDAQLRRYHAGNHYYVNEHQIYDTHGKLHWVSDQIVYATDPVSGDVIGIVLTMMIDEMVQERNQQQEALKNALEDAMQANLAKSRFLSNMSHDIRTPMNAILGYASIAAEHIDEHDTVEDSLHKILFSGKHLLELINDVLDMSRIESGKEVLDLTDVSLDDMINEIRAIVMPLTDDRHIAFHMQTDTIHHRCFKADRSKLRRVIVNVLSNAAKFTNENGEISCTITEEAAKPAHTGYYTICIKDNGIGMSPEFLEHIYELFSREHSSTISKVSGTGLGMAIAKNYIDLMNGTIDVTSTQNVGTNVTIRLPLEYIDHIQMKKTDVQPDSSFLSGKRVLIVDDSDLNRDIACLMLEEIEMNVDTAADGRIACEKLENSIDGYYDCVLMDIRMPVMDGLQATRAIRASKRLYLQNVPIIALSANVFTEDVKESLAAGMNAHIGKPFAREEFIQKLAAIMQ